MQIQQIKCPFCALSTPISRISKKTVLDPHNIAIIEIRECRGKKGLPIIETKALVNHLEEYSECFEKLKDITLGLIWSMWKYGLIKIEDLPSRKQFQKEADKEYKEYEAVEPKKLEIDKEYETYEKPKIKKKTEFIYQTVEEEEEEEPSEEVINLEYEQYDGEDKVYKDKEIDKEYVEY